MSDDPQGPPRGTEALGRPFSSIVADANVWRAPQASIGVLQTGERIYEVPITYRARSRDEGKKLTALDGFRVLRTLVRCRIT